MFGLSRSLVLIVSGALAFALATGGSSSSARAADSMVGATLSGTLIGSLGDYARPVLEARIGNQWSSYSEATSSYIDVQQGMTRDTADFGFIDLRPGTYRVRATSDWGIQTFSESVTLDWNESRSGLTVVVAPRAAVTGRVTDRAGRPFSDLEIYMTPDDPTLPPERYSSSTRTDEDGRFTMRTFADFTGRYKVWVGNSYLSPRFARPQWLGGGTDFETAASFTSTPHGGHRVDLELDHLISYTDIGWPVVFRDSIAWLTANGIARGYPDGTFRPVTPVARDAMAAFLYRYAGSPEFRPPRDSPFADISTSNQFYKEITWLAAEGISQGWREADGTRTFRPLENVSREAMAAFLYRQFGSPDFDRPDEPRFVDVNDSSEFFNAITWMREAKISQGWSVHLDDGTSFQEFRPTLSVNRDAMAAFLERTQKDSRCHPLSTDVALPLSCGQEILW